MKFSRKFILTVVIFILVFTLVFPFLYNKGKGNKGKEFYSSCQADCNPSNLLNTIILSLIPQTLYDNDGIKIEIDKTHTNSYIYVKKNCSIQPITVVINTYCTILVSDVTKINSLISKDILNNILDMLGVPHNKDNPIPNIKLKNMYVSAELFIDCSKKSNIEVSDLFVDMSYENPETNLDTGNDIINPFLNSIITNNSHAIKIIPPDCKNTNLATCILNDKTIQGCTSMVNLINSFINKNKLPKIDIPSTASSTISLICG